MRTHRMLTTVACIAVLMGALGLLIGATAGSRSAAAQTGPGLAAPAELTVNVGRGFTYQGYLEQNGTAVTAQCDLQFVLWDHPTTGSQLGSVQTVVNVTVIGGRFSSILNANDEMLANPFTGTARYLSVGVRCPTGSGAYTALTPRHTISPAPYASSLRPGAVISGTVPTGSGALNLTSNMDGIRITASGGDGVYVNAANGHGVNADAVNADGLNVRRGVNGVYLDQISANGVFVKRAGTNGLRIQQAFSNGIQVDFAGINGIQIQGAQALAGYFGGNVQIIGICQCVIGVVGRNVGADGLQAGDVVAVRGADAPTTADGAPLLHVARATADAAPIGVVAGVARPMTTADGLTVYATAADGAAAPGDLVALVIYGPVQLRATTGSDAPAPGAAVVWSAEGARRLRTTELNGLTVAEAAPTLGTALSTPDADGLLWVLVNPR